MKLMNDNASKALYLLCFHVKTASRHFKVPENACSPPFPSFLRVLATGGDHWQRLAISEPIGHHALHAAMWPGQGYSNENDSSSFPITDGYHVYGTSSNVDKCGTSWFMSCRFYVKLLGMSNFFTSPRGLSPMWSSSSAWERTQRLKFHRSDAQWRNWGGHRQPKNLFRVIEIAYANFWIDIYISFVCWKQWLRWG